MYLVCRLLLECSAHHRYLHSFPTRRSSDLPLALELRSRRGAMIGDVFMFVSGLYFRGKLTYALRFAAPPELDHPVIGCGVHVITPTAGLRKIGRAHV